jgi:C1A family cysteine protease
MWNAPGVLDQGGTAQCVAYSGFKYLITGPVLNHPSWPPVDLYRECQKVDEWEGEDWDGGTSVAALFKVLKAKGFVTEYKWAYDAATVVGHLLTTGPVVMGTSWYRNMFMPHEETGYLECNGANDGGHAWLAIGANKKRINPDKSVGAIRMVNSWGTKWGPQRGRAWISFNDLDKLIKDRGEACVATELKISFWDPREDERGTAWV